MTEQHPIGRKYLPAAQERKVSTGVAFSQATLARVDAIAANRSAWINSVILAELDRLDAGAE